MLLKKRQSLKQDQLVFENSHRVSKNILCAYENSSTLLTKMVFIACLRNVHHALKRCLNLFKKYSSRT